MSDTKLPSATVSDGKSPGFWFYPGDFERDMAGVSLAAQGLWTRMLGWAHQNEAHRGFLELPNGQPMTERQIALRVGRSLREVRPLLQELESYAVFSRTPQGTVFSRRMARETDISSIRRAAAKSRADKASRAANGTFAGPFDPTVKPDLIQQNTEQPQSKTPTVSDSDSDSDSDLYLENRPRGNAVVPRRSWDDFRDVYPECRRNMRIEPSCQAYVGRIDAKPGEHEKLMAGLRRHLDSDQWQRSIRDNGGRFIPSMEAFISNGLYLDFPPAHTVRDRPRTNRSAIDEAIRLLGEDERRFHDAKQEDAR
jgi:DNA-binding GntR family transcriptional regulator